MEGGRGREREGHAWHMQNALSKDRQQGVKVLSGVLTDSTESDLSA